MANQDNMDELLRLVKKLDRKIDKLEARIGELESRRQPSEDELILLAAAAAAHLGLHGKVRSVHRVVPGSWVQSTRSNIHNRSVTRSR